MTSHMSLPFAREQKRDEQACGRRVRRRQRDPRRERVNRRSFARVHDAERLPKRCIKRVWWSPQSRPKIRNSPLATRSVSPQVSKPAS